VVAFKDRQVLINLMRKRISWFPWIEIAVFVALGAIFVWVYREIPNVRNALLYARAAYFIEDLGSLSDLPSHAYRKALGFILASIPFVKLWGVNIGLKISSWFWTSLWLASSIPFYKRFSKYFDLKQQSFKIYFLVWVLNPLVFYQFISAYPDTMLAFAILWSLYFMDRLLSRDCKATDSVLFVLACALAYWTKHQGLLVFGILIFLLLWRRSLWGDLWKKRRASIYPGITTLGLLVVTVFVFRALGIPLFNYLDEKSNSELHPANYMIDNLKEFGAFIVVVYGLLAPLTIRRFQLAEARWPWIIAAVGYATAHLFFLGTCLNMRYFLPILPILSLLVVSNLNSLGSILKIRIAIFLFVFLNLYSLIYYNSIEVHSKLADIFPLPRVDNLRITAGQNEAAESIRRINEIELTTRIPIIFVSGYYQDGTFHVWEKDGLFGKNSPINYFPFHPEDTFADVENFACKNGTKQWIAYFYMLSEDEYLRGHQYKNLRDQANRRLVISGAIPLGPDAFLLSCST
jgi:hypothetical protein